MTPSNRRPAILLAVKMPAELVARLRTRYEVLGPLDLPFTRSVAALPREEAERVEAVLTMGTVDTTRAAMAALPALRLVCCFGSGFEGVDRAAAKERGIVLTHGPGANASAVVDLALGLLIASVRRMFSASEFLHSGEWERIGWRRRGGRGLTGRRIGIYGLGAIGEKIARRAAAFEMEVGYFNRRRRADVPYAYFSSLLELAGWADVLMVAVRADAGNRNSVDAAVLRALGPDGHVVNISRGAVIDEPALIAALQQGVIAGAGLDVFAHEPVVPAALRAIPHIALTPHIGGDSLEAHAALGAMAEANLDAFFSGRPVPNPLPEPL